MGTAPCHTGWWKTECFSPTAGNRAGMAPVPAALGTALERPAVQSDEKEREQPLV